MTKKTKSGRVFLTKGMSVDPVMYKAAMTRAAELRMTFSEYVRRCMEADLATGGDLHITPRNPKRRPGDF